MQKTLRLLAIEKIITGENITSQEALLRKLKGNGIICTQATLSRDLRQLGVSRIPDGEGSYRYSLHQLKPLFDRAWFPDEYVVGYPRNCRGKGPDGDPDNPGTCKCHCIFH